MYLFFSILIFFYFYALPHSHALKIITKKFYLIIKYVICEDLVQDLMKTLDTSQFANQKGQSMDHYLVMMIDKILRSLDGASKGEANAALVTLEDFSKAFDRQDATLAVKSFQDNGVRPSLIPLLISFFERR